jgi:hypothetical protein
MPTQAKKKERLVETAKRLCSILEDYHQAIEAGKAVTDRQNISHLETILRESNRLCHMVSDYFRRINGEH